MAAKLALILAVYLWSAASPVHAQNAAKSPLPAKSNAVKPGGKEAEGAGTHAPPKELDRHPYAGDRSKAKPNENKQQKFEKGDDSIPIPADQTKAKHPRAASARSSQPEDERVIEALDFLLLLEMLKDYHVLSESD
jgi:hypothetical protein